MAKRKTREGVINGRESEFDTEKVQSILYSVHAERLVCASCGFSHGRRVTAMKRLHI